MFRFFVQPCIKYMLVRICMMLPARYGWRLVVLYVGTRLLHLSRSCTLHGRQT